MLINIIKLNYINKDINRDLIKNIYLRKNTNIAEDSLRIQIK